MSVHSCDAISGERTLVCCSGQGSMSRFPVYFVGEWHLSCLRSISLGAAHRATQLYMARKILRGVRVSFLQCVALEVWASDEGVWGLGLGIPPERDK